MVNKIINKTLLGLLVTFLLFISIQIFPKNPVIKKVVIDAGHGGHDPGAKRGNVEEKDITLVIALKVGNLIKENCKDVNVIYTRTTDEFVELHRRAQIANENKADLFISIHCNANPSASAFGTETFVMGLHKSHANLAVAKAENSSILYESDYSKQYDGFDPNSAEANIIFSLFQNAYIDQSLDFAALLQEKFRERTKLNDRGVKQAGFLVLYKTAMPGVLIETGFLSNPKDQEYLTSNEGQSNIAMSVYKAFVEYQKQLEKTNGETLIAQKESTIPEDKGELKPNKNAKKNNPDNHTNTKLKHNDSSNEKAKNAESNGKSTENTETKTEDVNATVVPPEIKSDKKEIFFRIQFATSPTEKSTDSPEYKNLQNVKVYFHNGLYKYTIGNEKTFDQANALLKKIKIKGYKDAFIVAFLNEERVPITDEIKKSGK